jgi:hypothetical protein
MNTPEQQKQVDAANAFLQQVREEASQNNLLPGDHMKRNRPNDCEAYRRHLGVLMREGWRNHGGPLLPK